MTAAPGPQTVSLASFGVTFGWKDWSGESRTVTTYVEAATETDAIKAARSRVDALYGLTNIRHLRTTR